MEPKELAAQSAVRYVQDGMTIGLGSGSTAAFAILAIGNRISAEGLRIRGVPTSVRSRQLAEEVSIPIVELNDAAKIDLTIDGADEVNDKLQLIKGGGGALVREKLVAWMSREVTIVVDSSKRKSQLGAFPLPVAVLPFSWKLTQRVLEQSGWCSKLRCFSDTVPYLTDDGLYILDLDPEIIEDARITEQSIKNLPGVVEVGIFVDLATRVILAHPDGKVEEFVPADNESE